MKILSWKIYGKKLFVASVVFLFAQAIIYTCLAFAGSNTKNPTHSRHKFVPLIENGTPLNISVSETFLQEAHDLDRLLKAEGCITFVISPKILAHIWNVRQGIIDCVGFGSDCTLDGDDIFLGVDSSCIPKGNTSYQHFVQRLEDKGFSISTTQNEKTLDLPPKTTVFMTSLIVRRVYTSMLVVLHSREDNFWWHGSIINDPSTSKTLTKAALLLPNLLFMHREGAIPKFELMNIQLIKYHFLVPKDIPAFLRASSASASNFIECNYSQADKYFKTFGRDQSVHAVRFKHQAWKLLSRAKRILENLEVPFWLSSGTCLGYLRQCDFIPYSQDVDFGVFASDYKEEIIPAFLSHGFKLHHTFGKPNDSYQIAFEFNKVKLDVFFFYLDKEQGTMWNGGTEARSGQKYKYTFEAFSLCWTEFLELLVRVPCNTTRYIEANYGPNWFTPVTRWSWKSSPPNVERNGVWPKEEWSQVIKI